MHAPHKAARVMAVVREMRGGRDYDPAWRARMTGRGPYAALIARRFALAARRYGLGGHDWALETSRFRPPARAGDQLALF